MRKNNKISKLVARALCLIMAMSVLFSIGYIQSSASGQRASICRGRCANDADCLSGGDCVCGTDNFCHPFMGRLGKAN